MAGFNFEDYRQPWETGPQWELKREFMKKYSDTFPEDRLLCLAQAYSNIVLLNCRYPDSVMIQINNLAKPLEMRKKFQGNTDNEAQEEKSNKDNSKERGKLLDQKYGKPFKEIKFCASTVKIEPLDHKVVQESPSVSHYPIPEDASTSESKSLTTSLSGNQKSDSCNQATTFLKNTNIVNKTFTKEGSNIIVDTLGLEFVQNLVEKIRIYQAKAMSPLQCIISVGNMLNINDSIDFRFEEEPKAKPNDPVKFCCKLIIKKCFIASASATNKKRAKIACCMHSVDELINSIKSTSVNDEGKEAKINKTNNLNLPEEDYENLLKLQELLGNQNIISSNLKNVVSVLNLGDVFKTNRILSEVFDEEKKPKKLNTWNFFYKNILIASGSDTKLKNARLKGLKLASYLLKNLSNCKIQNDKLIDLSDSSSVPDVAESVPVDSDHDSDFPEEAINEPLIINEPFVLNKGLFYSSLRDSFALVRNTTLGGTNIKNILPLSASFCRKSFSYDFADVPGKPHQCKATILIDNVPVASGLSVSKDNAKLAAAVNAVDILRKKYYAIQIKVDYDQNSKIAREQVFNISCPSDILKDSNVGYKMLKSMGWTGGGLSSSGITEPGGIDATHNYGRGLGFSQGDIDTKTFRSKIDSMLKDYSQSNSMTDLIFAKAFSKEERKNIHQIAVKYNLHSSSQGKISNRFLVVRRKYSIVDLLKYLESVGGSDDKYQLIDASRDDNNPFKIE